MNGDADVLAITARTNSAESPSFITSQNMAIEIPVRTPPSDPAHRSGG